MNEFKYFIYSFVLLFFTAVFITPFLLFIPIYIFYYMIFSFERLYNYVLNLCKSFDQFANSAIFGNIDQTLSGRMGLAIENDSKFKGFFTIICKVLNKFFNQNDHCYYAIEFDRVKKRG